MKVQYLKSGGTKGDNYFNFIVPALFLAFILSVSFCNNPPVEKRNTVAFPYDLGNPDEKIFLPGKLKEISGLAYYEKDKILSIQDEEGAVFAIDPVNASKIRKYDFGKAGDYEDITVTAMAVWVLRSDGRLFSIENFEKNSRIVSEYKTPLSSKNNTEGLAYDRSTNSLLIACKESPSVDKEKPHNGYKAIYRFDLDKMEFHRNPEFLINLNRSDNYTDSALFNSLSLSTLRRLRSSLNPSGIAVNPVTDEIYLLSSVGKTLVIIDRKGKVIEYQDLDPDIFVQPEGICFSPSGNMFISSEGKGGKGYVLKFVRKSLP